MDGQVPALNDATMELSPFIVNLHVLIAHAAASPVPAEKMPGVDGELALRTIWVPFAMVKLQVPPPSGPHSWPVGPTLTTPVFSPLVVMLSVAAST